jgi:hypothetical protein
VEHTFFISTLIGMRTKIITLRLNQVSRQNCGTIAIVVSDGSRERRNRNTILHSICNDIAQRLLIIISDLLEVRRQQQVSNASILLIGISDLLQELSTNDAAGTEDFSDLAVVQIPVVFIRSSTQLGEALSVRDDFAQIQSATNFLNELRFITCCLGCGPVRTFEAATRWSLRKRYSEQRRTR